MVDLPPLFLSVICWLVRVQRSADEVSTVHDTMFGIRPGADRKYEKKCHKYLTTQSAAAIAQGNFKANNNRAKSQHKAELGVSFP